MEDIITKIISIEQKAQSIADETAEKLNALNGDIVKEIEVIAQEYRERSAAALSEIREQEQLEERALIESQSLLFEKECEEYRKLWEQNAKSLEDAIFIRISGCADDPGPDGRT